MGVKLAGYNYPEILYSKSAWTVDSTNGRCYSLTASASITIKFTGTYIRFFASKQSNGDNACTVTIDGDDYGTVSFYNATTVHNQDIFIKDDLSSGEHEMVITRSTTASKYIFCQGFNINDTDNYLGRTTYAGSPSGFKSVDMGLGRSLTTFFMGGANIWNTGTNASCYNGSYAYSDTSGAEIRFGFTGTSIKILSFVSNTLNDQVSIQIDNQDAVTVSEYFPTAIYNTCLYQIDGLDDTEHDVVITSLSATRLTLDFVYVLSDRDIIQHSDFRRFNITEWYGSNTEDERLVGLNQTHPVQMYYDNTKDFMILWQVTSGGENTSASVYTTNTCGLTYVYMAGTTSAPVDRIYYKNGATNSYIAANSTFRSTKISVCCIYYSTGNIKIFCNGELRYQGSVTLPDSGYYPIKTFRNGSSPASYVDGVAKTLYAEIPDIPLSGAYAFLI